VSFLGGIDLCDGRYDTQVHPLFRTLGTTHYMDFHQPNFRRASIQKGGPREPWHDVHCRVEGPAAWDVLDNFEQRWRKQGSAENLLVALDKAWALREAATGDAECWNVHETTRISANGTPNLSTSVVVPGGLPRAIPVSAMPKSIQKDKNSKLEYNIYFITLIRIHLFGTCRVQVHRDRIKHK
jgi:phosphatidylserine/phosphatidylglycerophosphate/cardiolipin synthase-like enzyme